jgi:hypothetical protein
MDICKRQVPPSFAVSPGHIAACWLHADPADKDAGDNGLFRPLVDHSSNQIGQTQ